METIIYITLTIILLVILVIIAKYNQLITLLNKVKKSSSNIEVYLKKRFDLIPNLVEVCKGYAKHEQETLVKVTELRTSFNDHPTDKNREELNEIYKQFIALAESYPEIKAGEHYLKLQKELANVENEIQASRRIYINSITDYNNKVMRFPTSILAAIFGFKQHDLPKYDYSDVSINFSENK